MPKLTQRSVTALPVEPKDYFVWDATLPGFGVRVLPSGVKTYQVQYRKGARTRRAALGRHGTITTEEARTIARGMLGQVAGGLDPVEEIALEQVAEIVREPERFPFIRAGSGDCDVCQRVRHTRLMGLFRVTQQSTGAVLRGCWRPLSG